VISNFTIFVQCQHLKARKIAGLFSFNHGVGPFYVACCFDEMNRAFVLCLLNTSFKTAISKCYNLIFLAETNDHGIRLGNTRRILAQWWHMMTSRVALVLPYWAMRLALYRLISMAVEMTSKGGVLFCHRQFVVMHKCS
jgi:hypothetical protein